MGVKVTFNDNSAQVLSQLDANKKAALLALGTKAVGLIVEQMETGYHTPHKNRAHGKKYINVFGQKLKKCPDKLGRVTDAKRRVRTR